MNVVRGSIEELKIRAAKDICPKSVSIRYGWSLANADIADEW